MQIMPLNFKKFIDKKGKEKYFCLEISSSFLRGTLLTSSDQKIEIIDSQFKTLESPREENISKVDPEIIKEFINDIKIPSNSEIIILGSSSFIFTVPAWVKVQRESKEEVEEAELENLISQAVWKFLNVFRPQAVDVLGISETDILLADIRNLGVKVNGHKVLNPIGFKAKTIEFLIEETFVNRDYFRAIEEIFSQKSKPVFISELGLVDSQVVFRSFNFEKPFTLTRFFPGSVLALSCENREKFKEDISEPIISLVGDISWDKDIFISRLSEKLGLSYEPSSKIIEAFYAGEVSSKIEKFIKDLISLEWKDFTKKISKKISPSKPVFIIEDKKIPEFVLRKKEKPKMEKLDIQKIFKKLGFEIGDVEESLFSALAGFIEHYFSNHDDRLNKLARRRAKWLIP